MRLFIIFINSLGVNIHTFPAEKLKCLNIEYCCRHHWWCNLYNYLLNTKISELQNTCDPKNLIYSLCTFKKVFKNFNFYFHRSQRRYIDELDEHMWIYYCFMYYGRQNKGPTRMSTHWPLEPVNIVGYMAKRIKL